MHTYKFICSRIVCWRNKQFPMDIHFIQCEFITNFPRLHCMIWSANVVGPRTLRLDSAYSGFNWNYLKQSAFVSDYSTCSTFGHTQKNGFLKCRDHDIQQPMSSIYIICKFERQKTYARNVTHFTFLNLILSLTKSTIQHIFKKNDLSLWSSLNFRACFFFGLKWKHLELISLWTKIIASRLAAERACNVDAVDEIIIIYLFTNGLIIHFCCCLQRTTKSFWTVASS